MANTEQLLPINDRTLSERSTSLRDGEKYVTLSVLVLSLSCVSVVLYFAAYLGFQSNVIEVDISNPLGWIATLSSVLIWGTYSILMKNASIVSCDLEPAVFQLYFSTGAALCGVALSLLTKASFTWYGVLTAFIWVVQQVFNFIGISECGMGIGTAIGCGSTVVMSYLYGMLFREAIENKLQAFAGIIGVVGGIVIVATASMWETRDYEPLERRAERNWPKGLLSALGTGIMNASLVLPYVLFTKDMGEDAESNVVIFSYMFSFAACILPVTLVLHVCWLFYRKTTGFSVTGRDYHARTCGLPGVVIGIGWMCAYFCSIYGTRYLGQTIGYPLTQLCLCVNGLWAIVYLKELTKKTEIGVFMIGLVVIISAAIVLTFSGK